MVRWILIPSIKLYQKLISPLFPPSCRYYPTCSHYAVEALQKKGMVVGVVLTIYRILRCNPFSAGGFDPVEKKD